MIFLAFRTAIFVELANGTTGFVLFASARTLEASDEYAIDGLSLTLATGFIGGDWRDLAPTPVFVPRDNIASIMVMADKES